VPTDYLSVPPLVLETADTVRARFDMDATAGLDPADPEYPDLTIGSFYYICSQPGVLEGVRIWDSMTEMIAAMFPGTAFGEYLDLHGETINLPRKAEIGATGEVTFTGEPDTLVPAGTVLSTVVPDPSAEEPAQEFTTDESITLVIAVGPTSLMLGSSLTGGTLPAGNYFYAVTAVTPDGETIASNEETVVLTGATSRVTLTWAGVVGATSYRVYRGSAPGSEIQLAEVGVTGFVDDGAAVPAAYRVPTNRVTITALVPGTAGNVAPGTITLVNTPIEGSPAVVNLAPMSGGADLETDDQYRKRILLAYATPPGAGNQADYIRWALAFDPIGYATCQPLWAGPGTVRVIVTDQNNQPVGATVVAGFQNYLDPVPGKGAGIAPIGAIVAVSTPMLRPISVSALVSFKDGFSLDGGGATIAQRRFILDLVKNYVNTLKPGDDVILNKIVGQIMLVERRAHVGSVLLNGRGNVAVALLEVPEIQDADISLG
jgi:uncharacterized phage protein gp47/JayE